MNKARTGLASFAPCFVESLACKYPTQPCSLPQSMHCMSHVLCCENLTLVGRGTTFNLFQTLWTEKIPTAHGQGDQVKPKKRWAKDSADAVNSPERISILRRVGEKHTMSCLVGGQRHDTGWCLQLCKRNCRHTACNYPDCKLHILKTIILSRYDIIRFYSILLMLQTSCKLCLGNMSHWEIALSWRCRMASSSFWAPSFRMFMSIHLCSVFLNMQLYVWPCTCLNLVNAWDLMLFFFSVCSLSKQNFFSFFFVNRKIIYLYSGFFLSKR